MVKSADNRDWFDKAPVALFVVETNSGLLEASNDAAVALLDATGSQLQGRFLADTFSTADCKKVQAALLEPHSQAMPCIVRDCQLAVTPLGIVPRILDLSVRRISSSDAVVAVEDATPRIELEEKLRQAGKMEAVGMLAGGIAHDFNNLLTIIAGYSQMLQASPDLDNDRDRSAIEQVLKASERAAELTGQLLAFSRRRPVQAHVLDPARLIDQTTLMLRRLIGEHIELRIQQAAGVGRIHGDVSQLQQVVMNLVINSRDAMPDGGMLMIETSNVELDDFMSSRMGVRPGAYVLIAVSDTGKGMDTVTRERIFEPFFTTKATGKGTGLGLSTVAGIVKRYGGAMDVYSELGHGTAFKVFFPRVDAAATEEKHENGDSDGGSETVLLAEDEEGVRRMVTASLERRGYRVLVAASGREALDVSRNHPGKIDLLVSDLVMPFMNGRELEHHLSEERPGMPVLLISGYPGETIDAIVPAETDAHFLQKPFSPSVLTKKVREILNSIERDEHKVAGN